MYSSLIKPKHQKSCPNAKENTKTIYIAFVCSVNIICLLRTTNNLFQTFDLHTSFSFISQIDNQDKHGPFIKRLLTNTYCKRPFEIFCFVKKSVGSWVTFITT